MNVFENLIEELKDENLLEGTAAHVTQDKIPSAVTDPAAFEDIGSNGGDRRQDQNIPEKEKPANDTDFFRKRAMEEVSSLQMVEHILSGVEREHMKTASVSHDDLAVKKALHKFLQVYADPRSPEYAEAGLRLRQEIESWSFALFERDQKMSVANLRRFCEDSRPVLSSQALISLARFYRNSLFSEDVRGKFDFVMTRLFSRDGDRGSRKLLFPMQDMVNHILTIYANWSSMALFSSEEDQIEVALTVTRFNEFGVEIESADSLDEMLEADFFNKVRLYKEESAEMFYVPAVVAAAIECNVKIGNNYVRLIEAEKAVKNSEGIENKYGFAHDQVVSGAAAKTLLLVDVLKTGGQEVEMPKPDKLRKSEISPAFRQTAKPAEKIKARSKVYFDMFGVNKWLIVLAFIAIVASVGVYLWSEKVVSEDSAAVVATPLQIDDADINKHLRGIRSSSETLYALAQPAYDALNEQEQKALLQKVLKLANDRNLPKVTFLNSKGRTIAFASKDRLDLFTQ